MIALVAVLSALAALIAVSATTIWLGWTAGRLDRMHLRCQGTAAALDAALARRRAAVLELATQPDIDPAVALLLIDAGTAEDTGGQSHRWQKESDLSALLRAVWPSVARAARWDDLAVASARVRLARRIHNDQASTALGLRSRRWVR